MTEPHNKAKPRNTERPCVLIWPSEGSREPVKFIADIGGGFAIVERDDFADDGKPERIEVPISRLEWGSN